MKLKVAVENVEIDKSDYEFSSDHGEIVVGRAPDSDIVLPAFDTRLSRKHLSLEEKLGRYSIRMQADNPVFLDGKRLYDGAELPLECTLALGAPDGPRLVLAASHDSGDDLPATDLYTRQAHPGAIAEATSRKAGFNRLVVIAVALALIAGGTYFYLGAQRQDREFGALLASVDEFYQSAETVRDQQDALPEALRAIVSSVYVVGVNSAAGEVGFGTAWVVNENTLATNAHVAEVFPELQAGQHMFVRSTGPEHATHRIEQVLLHPGYGSFAEFIGSNPRVIANMQAVPEQIQPVHGYDVALLRVEAGAELGPPIPIASDETLQALRPGDRVGYAGFPMETNTLALAMMRKPEPVLQMGSITSVTDFFGVRPSDATTADLVQHSLPAHGGASGSPIVNERGEAIAVLSAGNMVNLPQTNERVSSGIGIWFGQRANLVNHLLDGDLEQTVARLPALWTDQLEPFDQYSELFTNLIDALVEGRGRQASDAVLNHDGAFERLELNGKEILGSELRHAVDAGRYLAIAGSPSGQLVGLYLFDEAKRARLGEGVNPIAHVEFQVKQKTDLYIFVESGHTEPEPYLMRIYRLDDQT